MGARKNNLLLNIFVMVLGILAFGFLSASSGKELSWDLAGYHYYNPYALLHGRFNIDYWPPSSLQSYLPPTLDFFTYYLINHFNPLFIEFILGAIHGINIALLFYISRFFISEFIRKPIYQIVVAAILAFMGIYAPTVFPYIGSFSNDNTVSIFILVFVLWFLSILRTISQSGYVNSRQVFFANLILGMGVGAKLSVAPYMLGSFIALLFLPVSLQNKCKLVGYAAVGASVGFVLINGYWMAMMWQHYGNPFFPFLNGIFHSPYFPAENWREVRYMPSNMLEAIFFPFYFAATKRIAEFYFLDFRFAIIYILFFLAGILTLCNKSPTIFKRIDFLWFYLFFIFSYIIWEINFSVMRYLGVLQMFAALMIFLLIMQLTTDFVRRIAAVTVILMFIFISMVYTKPERFPRYGHDYFNIQLPAIVQHEAEATVILPYANYVQSDKPRPNHYLIPSLPQTWRFTAIPFEKYHYVVPIEVREFIKRGPKQVFLLSTADYMPYMYKAAHDLQLEPNGACGTIESDRQRMLKDTVLICPVKAK